MEKAKITYRLNSRDNRAPAPKQELVEPNVIQLHEEEFHVEPAAQERVINPFTNDSGNWDSPYDAETRRIEQLIRETNERRNAGTRGGGSAPNRMQEIVKPPGSRDIVRASRNELTELREEEPEWEQDRPQTPVERKNSVPDNGFRNTHYDPVSGYYDTDADPREQRYANVSVSGPRYVRHSKTPWMKIVASVGGAVVTGVALGFFVLSMFSENKSADPNPLPNLNGKQETAVTATDKSGTDAGKKQGTTSAGTGAGTGTGSTSAGVTSAAANAIAVNIPARSYFVIQGGSFTTAQSAETHQNDLRKKGLAAVSETSDKSYVYVALAATKDSAKELGKQLEGKTDVYTKSYDLPQMSRAAWSGNKDTLQNYLSQSDKLVQMFSKLTLTHLSEANLTPIEDATVLQVKTSHEAWSQTATAVLDGATEEAKAQLNKMNNAMNSAKKSIDEYKKTPSSSMLWQTQTYTMQFVLAEKELLRLISVQ